METADRGNLETPKNHKVRITIHLDSDIVSYFKNRSFATAKRYQTLINDALREYTGLASQPGALTDLVRRVKRLEEELLRRPS
ncbi:MAG: CopG family transcriptional regulator [Proteobacteria bacterium]|nr:CopG family transcriptional regulator [Pseudomonadota bacterium]NIS68089.1 CopG family transcriptional regulator [Pseudomonadota bacterium]